MTAMLMLSMALFTTQTDKLFIRPADFTGAPDRLFRGVPVKVLKMEGEMFAFVPINIIGVQKRRNLELSIFYIPTNTKLYRVQIKVDPKKSGGGTNNRGLPVTWALEGSKPGAVLKRTFLFQVERSADYVVLTIQRQNIETDPILGDDNPAPLFIAGVTISTNTTKK